MRLQWKLFLIILISSSVLVVGMYLATQWTVDQGLLKYVNVRERQSYEPLAEKLAEARLRFGTWSFLEDDPSYLSRLQRQNDRRRGQELGNERPFRGPGSHRPPPHERHMEGRRPPPPHHEDRFSRPPPPPPPKDGPPPPRISILDELKSLVVGPDLRGDETLIDIVHPDGESVLGYLAFPVPKRLTKDFDLELSAYLEEGFLWVGGLMLMLSALLALPLSYLMIRRIKLIAEGTQRIASGELDYRINLKSGDELEALADDFNSLAQTLEDDEKARKRWIADISHELRTPLAVTSGEIEAMIDGVREPSVENLESAQAEIRHLNRLVEDLYQLTNDDIGALQYRKKELDLNQLLQRQVELITPMVEEKGLQIESSLPRVASLIWADSDRMQQVLQNILTNALKYTDAPGLIQIKLHSTESELVLSIEDSAPGVRTDQLERLFDPLYRVDQSRNRETGGSGLGLGICKQILRSHHAGIELGHSSLGGLQVIIRFPSTNTE